MTARVDWRCRIGWHRYIVFWENIAPQSAGGPVCVYRNCERCGLLGVWANRQ